MSPKGNLAVTAILAGSNNKAAFFHRPKGYVSILKVDGKKVTKIKEIDVGGLPEAAVFTPDGAYILVGNYLNEDFSILKVDGTDVSDTGKRFKVPGHPASARMSPH
jgi:DNA-binding beta-propeller fold protein YncE